MGKLYLASGTELVSPTVTTTNLQFSPSRWDDAECPLLSLAAYGFNPPYQAVFRTNEVSTGAGKALSAASDAYFKAPDKNFDWGTALSFSFWARITTSETNRQRYIFSKASSVGIYHSGFKIYTHPSATTSIQPSGVFLSGQWVHVVTTMRKTAAGTDVKTYLNSVLSVQYSTTAAMQDNTADMYLCGKLNANTTDRTAGAIDDFRIYSTVLSQASVSALYNAGVGTSTPGTPTADSAFLELHWKFQDDANNGTAAETIVGGGTHTWAAEAGALAYTTGIVGANTSAGVPALLAPANEICSLGGSKQFTHSYKPGGAVQLHFHYMPMSATVGNINIGIEWTIAGINNTFPVTVLSETGPVDVHGGHTPAAYAHRLVGVATLPAETIATLGISTIWKYRVYRKGTDEGVSQYPDPIDMASLDAHIEMDSIGSNNAISKTD